MTDLLKQDIAAGGKWEMTGGLFFKIVAAQQPVTVTFQRVNGGSFTASAAPAGFQVGLVPETRRIELITIESAVDQEVTILVGDELADVTDNSVDLSGAARRGATLVASNRIALTLANTKYFLNQGHTNAKLHTRNFLLKAPASNAGPVSVGVSGQIVNDGFEIDPGETIPFSYGFSGSGDAGNPAGENYIHFSSTAAADEIQFIQFTDVDP